jgi:hypothetical protein
MAKSQSMSRSAAQKQGRSKASNAIRRSITTSRSAVKSGPTAVEEVEEGVGGGKG